MKPSEQLKKTNLTELDLQLEQVFDDILRYQTKLTTACKEHEDVRREREEMLKAIKQLESKGL